ncbi:hypothetical protein RD792_014337 [Penstemon davidsonii]|uniref:Scarecrow-like protein 32 n=1 Tax=Penstemon davidsonii TaxID=160366 RepID=A0ABR0CQV2_9LAMI|nr:hypothetical protein RD792_014337 [Penstemon davidsonii]
MKAELRQNPASTLFATPQNSNISSTLTLGGPLSNLDGACIEKLLLHCANALENNDVTLAQQVMWVLNNVASSIGDPNQRLASYFLRALISRASRLCPTTLNFNNATSDLYQRLMSVTELAGYVDLIPWHRFGFCASNSAILKATQGFSKIHVLDFSITHCMQWPTFIDALSKGSERAPSLRISVLSWRPLVPPLVNVSIEEIGLRLSSFAKIKDVPFEFNVIEVGLSTIPQECEFNYDLLLRQLNPSTLKLRDDEALVVNCQNWLRYLPDEHFDSSYLQNNSCRDSFLDMIKSLNPCVVTVVDEDCDLGASNGLGPRISTCFNYLWIPFDALETFMPKNSTQRIEFEADVGHKIENVIGFEGIQRIERLESCIKFSQRMGSKGFFSLPFCEETTKEVKLLLDEHASGWGMKKDEDMLILTWKGHNSVYASVWVPNREFRENSIPN